MYKCTILMKINVIILENPKTKTINQTQVCMIESIY